MGVTYPVPACMRRLTKRSQFLRAARGRRASRSFLTLQATRSPEAEPGIGFTVTKKTGNSPERNRIKRRLRAAVEQNAARFHPHFDYVLIGRRGVLSEPYPSLVQTVGQLAQAVHKNPKRGERTE